MREIDKRLKALEQQANAGKNVIAVVDVRDLQPSEAAALLDAKRAELASTPSAKIIILQHEERAMEA